MPAQEALCLRVLLGVSLRPSSGFLAEPMFFTYGERPAFLFRRAPQAERNPPPRLPFLCSLVHTISIFLQPELHSSGRLGLYQKGVTNESRSH